MRLLRGLYNPGPESGQCVATIGNFDGVHRGHQAILSQLRQQAGRLGLPALVIIFEPQPLEFFHPDSAPPRLMSLREKYVELSRQGIDYLFCLRFDHTLSGLSAVAFVQRILVQHLGIRHLVVGDDFRFGDARTGDFSLLRELGEQYGFSVENTHTIRADGSESSARFDRISSTAIRHALAAADLVSATNLLGRPYRISGRVVPGAQLGRQLGFPTANVALRRRRVALQGVFLVRVQLASGTSHFGMANIGVKPTVDGRVASLEVHLFDFSAALYGQHISVEFLNRVREERRFESLQALQQQIARDVEAGRHLVATMSGAG
jgi:riboflavin kinase/FMN adenylyltransferase